MKCSFHFPLLLALIFFCNFGYVNAQNLEQKISGQFENKNLNEVLKNLQKNYNLKFAFDEKKLSSIIVKSNVKNESLEDFLSDYLPQKELWYVILDNTIIIKPSEEIPEEYRPKIIEETYTFSGFVYDSLNKERLPYASIKIVDEGFFTSTNLNGFFSFKDIPIQEGEVSIYYIGYRPVKTSLKDKNLKIALLPNTAVLDEVLIEGSSNHIVDIEDNISKVSINPAEMQNLPNLGEVDVFRSIQLLPGINGTFETAANINIRGSAPDHNLILFDGFNIYHLDHFFGIFSAFNNNSIKNIKVYKGGFEARYGGRVGGVLDITGKTGNTEKPEFGIGLNFIGLNGTVETPIYKNTTFFFSARRSLTDFFPSESYKDLMVNVLTNDINAETTNNKPNFEQLDPVFNFYDLNAKVTHRFSDDELLSLSVYHGRDILRIDNSELFPSSSDVPSFNFNTENNTRWGNLGVGLNYSRQWESNLYTNINLGFSNYFSRVTYGASKEFLDANEELDELIVFEQKNDVEDLSLKIENGWNYSQNNELEFGIWTTSNIISYSVFIDSSFVEDISEAGNQTSAYVQNRFKFANRGEIVPGIRFNYYDLTRQLYVEPRINANYRILPKLSLKGAYGKYSQMVSRVLRRNIFASNPDFWVLSDGENIPVLQSDHLIGGFNYTLNKFWIFDVEIYQKWDRGVLEYIPPEGIFANNAPDYSPYFRGSAESKGIELMLKKVGKNYNGWISYAYSFSDNQFEELNENQVFPSNQDQRHEIKFVNIYDFKGFEFSAVWIYGSGRPYTAPLGTFTLDENNGLGGTDVLYVSDINSFRLPDYHRLDISVNYKFNLGKVEAEAGLSIFNLYDRKNVKYRRFLAVDTDIVQSEELIGNTNYIQRDIELLGRTPNFSLQFKF